MRTPVLTQVFIFLFLLWAVPYSLSAQPADLDLSFDPGTGADNVVRALAHQSDGKIIIGGDLTTYKGTGRNRVARLNGGGSCDISITNVSVTGESCSGSGDGEITVTASCSSCANGITYSLSGAATASNAAGAFTGLPAGTYTVTAEDTDDAACSAIQTDVVIAAGTDTEAPVLTGCPGPQTLIMEAGLCTAVLPDLTGGVTVMDNCPTGSGVVVDFSTVAAGSFHSIAIKDDGSLWAWGLNDFGQLGTGNSNIELTPVQVGTATDWATVSGGDSHSLALKNDGSLWAWGSNEYGQLGDGSSTDQTLPVQVGSSTNWVSVTSKVRTSFGIKSDGSLWAWGDNGIGQLGTGSSNFYESVPVQVGTDMDWVKIEAGDGHSLGLKSDGSLWAWGGNGEGQLGTGSSNFYESVPVQVGTATDWATVSAGVSHSLALKNDGSLWSWGWDFFGQLGDGGSNMNQPTPVQVGMAMDWTVLSAGMHHSLALKSNGTLWAWGWDDFDQLGDGDGNTDQPMPVQIGIATDWVKIVSGYYHSMAFKNDGSLWSWGNNASGQTGSGIPANEVASPTDINFTAAIGSSGGMTITQSPAVGTLLSAGVHTITLSATDATGNTGTCGIEVTVDDNQAPVITCPQNIEEVATSPSGAVVIFADATSTDNCSAVVTQTGGPASGETFPIGETVVEYTATDDATLTDLCTFTVTICNIAITSVNPVDETCPAAEDGTLTVTAACVTCAGGAADIRYSIDNVEFSNTTGVFSGLAPGTYMVYVQDVNNAGCTESNGPHSVSPGVDTEAPVLTGCPDPQTLMTEAGLCTAALPDLTGGVAVADNCPVQGSGNSNFSTISDGYFHSLAIENDGTLWAWGDDSYGQLGDGGGNAGQSSPVQIGTTSNWASVSAGLYHSLALKNDGTLWAWGLDSFGQLGDGGSNTSQSSPVQIGTASNWASVSAGFTHSLALKNDGTLWAWGYDEFGQLGDGGSNTDQSSPVQIGTGTSWATVSGGYNHSLALKNDGTLWAWGLNFNGQLGDGGSNTNQSSPVQIGTGSDWASVSGGGNHSLALKNDGTLWAWGDDSSGQLGDGGSNTGQSAPVQIGTASNWASVSAGGQYSLALKNDGTLWAWGEDFSGQLGDGGSNTDQTAPVQIGTGSDWASVSAGVDHSLALKNDGTLWAWGWDGYGQLGDGGSNTNQNAPVNINFSVATGSDELEVTQSPAPGTLLGPGEHTITLSSTDAAGNTGTCTVTVMVEDSEDPVAICPGTAPTVVLDGSGNGALAANALAGGNSTDNCSGLAETSPETIFICGDGPTATVVLTATDASGNTHTANCTVNIDDSNCCAIDVIDVTTNDETCPGAADGTLTVTANCSSCANGITYNLSGAATVSNTTGMFMGLPDGTYMVTVEDTDDAACSAIQTDVVIAAGTDTEAPVLTGCPGPQTLIMDAGLCTVALPDLTGGVTVMDNCPTASGGVADFSTVSGGSYHNLAIKDNGSLWAWGANQNGQLGIGNSNYGINQDTPVQVGSDTDWASVATGNSHSLAIKNDGGLWAWGLNGVGQLGTGSSNGEPIPVQVGTDTDWSSVVAGGTGAYTLALKSDGSLWAWGGNGRGQLGTGSNIDESTPVQVGTDTDWATISAGDIHSLAIKNDGSLWAWGENGNGQLGTDSNIDELTPVRVGTATNWMSIAAGASHNLGIKSDGSLWAWGFDGSGQLGDGGNNIDQTSPVQVGTATDWVGIAAGEAHSLGVRNGGSLWAWGLNHVGQLGTGSNIEESTPVQVGADMDWISVQAGYLHGLAYKSDGSLWAWGWNGFGQTGSGSGSQDTAPVDINFSVATGSSSGLTVTQSPAAGTLLGPGEHTITLSSTDAAGNTGTCTVMVTVEDNEAPVITCPQSIEEVATSPSGAVVTFADATATDNCGATVAQTGGPASGEAFPIGETTVEFTATDGAGLTDVCTFTVTVTGCNIAITSVSPVDETCPAAEDGTLTVTAACVTCAGGAADIRYSIDNVEFSNTTGVFSGLAPGTYMVYVQDVNNAGCTESNGPHTVASGQDTEDPVAVCPAMAPEVVLSGGSGTLAANALAGGNSTDNCGSAVETSPETVFTCSDAPSAMVELTATDPTGNTSTAQCPVAITTPTCGGAVDLTAWTQEGDLGDASDGNWVLEGGGSSVLQTVNGRPTFFISPDNFYNSVIEGSFSVETNGDDDYIGFVMGYSKPNAGTAWNDYDFILFDWKQAQQDQNCDNEGFSLGRMQTGPADLDEFFCKNDPSLEILATDYGPGKGWSDNTLHAFRVEYTATNIKIYIDNNLIFDVVGAFPDGRFGFYNYSQSNVRYQQLGLPFSVVTTQSDVSCPGASDGSATAIVSGSDQGPYTYLWSDGQTSQTATGLSAGTYQVTVTGSNCCEAVGEVTISDADVVAPTITCPGDVTASTDAGICTASGVSLGTATASDNCAATPTVSSDAAGPFGLGSTTVTFTADDGNGNTNTCTMTVTVEDNEAPEAICPAAPPTVVLDANGDGTLPADALAGGNSTDNCSSVTETSPQMSFTCADFPSATVVVTATDANNNISTADCTVNIDDANADCCTISITNVSVTGESCSGSGDGEITVTASCSSCANGITYSLSGAATASNAAGAFTGLPAGTYTVTAEDTDDAACSATQSGVSIAAADTESPSAVCPAMAPEVVLSGGSGTLAANALAGGNSTDNCGSAVETSPETVFTCSDAPLAMVELTATDPTGNTSTAQCPVAITTPTCGGAVDLTAWTREGDLGDASDGNWVLGGGGSSVLQTVNGRPTFFISPDNFYNSVIEGSFSVETNGDDDYIGFVMGYSKPNAGTAWNDYDFILFDWKQAQQDQNCDNEGFSLGRMQTGPADLDEFFCKNDPSLEILATDYGPGKGWSDNTLHAFRVEYTATNIKIYIDNNLIFDVVGAFPDGRFGFYNYSQSNVRYQQLGLPFSVVTTQSDVSCPGASDGSATAIVSGSDQGPYTYLWSDGQTSQTATGLSAGTYQVTVTGSNCCEAVGEVTISDADVVAPTITCPGDVTVSTDAGICTASGVSLGTATASDNCAATPTVSSDAAGPFGLGSTTVTFTADDGNGNTNTCTMTVTVEDNEAPEAICPAAPPTVVLDANGDGTLPADALAGGNSTDNCSSVTETSPQMSFTCADFPSATVVVTATDANNNISTADCTVNIDDANADCCTISITNVSVTGESCSGSGDGEITVTASCSSCANGITYSLSGAATASNAAGAFTGLPAGTYTVTAEDTDDAACSATQSGVSIAAADTESPSAVCPAMAPEVVLSGGSGTLAANALAGGNSTDNCGSAVETSPETVFTCSDAPSAMVELTATDPTGNTSTAQCPVAITTPTCGGAVDLTAWTREGDLGDASDGNWVLEGGGSSVLQTVNGRPTFFISPDNFYNSVIEGSFSVETNGDDDYIGFVMGYSKPNAGTAWNDYDFILFDWKQAQQDQNCDNEGFSLGRMQTGPADLDEFFCKNDPSLEILATDYGPGKGWSDNTLHAFRVEYTATNIKIYIDNNLIFDVVGAFPDGRFGFYNYSQSNVRYQQLGLPFSVVTTQSDVSCPGASDGSATAIVSGSDQGPYTYLWSDGQTSQTATGLSAGTYQVTVTGSNCCEAVGEVTISDADVVAPTITCPGDVTASTDAGLCTASGVSLGTATASDNCAATPTVSSDAAGPFGLGSTTVTFTADDGNGNTNTCTMTVTVEDNEAPEAICPAAPPTVVLDANGDGTLPADALAGGNSTDNCSSVTETSPQMSFTCADFPSATVVVTATDANNNISTADCTVNIDDANADCCTISITNVSVTGESCSGSGDGEITVTASCSSCANGITYSLSGAATASNAAGAFTGLPAGTYTVTAEDTDDAACSATQSGVSIAAADTESPSAVCPAMAPEVVLSGGSGTLAANALAGGNSTDNCGSAVETSPETVFTCSDAPLAMVELTATDPTGNTSTAQCPVAITTPTCGGAVDLTAWTREGDLGDASDGNWVLGGGGSSVLQTVNGRPTFFISPDNFYNSVIEGSFSVETNGDDDYIGFVMGYSKPNAGTAWNDYDFILFDWKQAQQDQNCDNEGFSLGRMQTGPADLDEFFCKNDPSLEILATDYGPGKGWSDNTLHAFRVEYTATNIKIYIDNNLIFDVVGAFPDGRFGFYNYSQSNVRYQQLGLPFSVVTTQSDVSCPGASDGSATAIVSGSDQGPYTYLWSDGQTSQTATGLSAGTYQVTVTGSNCCEAVGEVTISDADVVAPTITCPGDVTVSTDAGICTASGVSLGTATASDNCAATPTVSSDAAGPFGLGSTTVTFTADDGNGNTNTCTMTVTVEDNEGPEAICPSTPPTVVLDANGDGALPADALAGGNSTDNCSGLAETSPETIFICGDGPTATVVLTAADVSGNTHTANCTVNIDDSNCCDIDIIDVTTNDETCPGAADGTLTVTANCSFCANGITYSLSGAATASNAAGTFTGLPTGTYTVTVEDTDDAACSATQTDVVIAAGTDTEAPVLTGCPGPQTLMTEAGECTVPLPDYTAGVTVTDNCADGAQPTAKFAPGRAHTVAIAADGSLWAWGWNSEGQLGIGSTTDQISPVQVGTDTDWASVNAADYHTLALKTDGSLWVWGSGFEGRLGTGSNSDETNPVQVGAGTGWVSISAAGDHSLALKSDGTLWAWGSNDDGQLGIGSITDQNSPVQVGTATDWASVSAGIDHTLALKTDGSLWAWGSNIYGQLGDGSATRRTSPVQVGTDTDWGSFRAGRIHSLAVKTDGSLWAWGGNLYGQLGTGSNTSENSPAQVGATTDWASVSAGIDHSMALKTDGSLWAWGRGIYGVLGTGSSAGSTSPVQVGDATDWTACNAGGFHTAALKADGSLLAWGWNTYGQLGIGSNTNQSTPTVVPNFTNDVGGSAPTVDQLPAPGTALSAGTHEITLSSTDAAGNTGTCTVMVTVEDNQAPDITCPQNIEEVATSPSGAVVTFADATATDNCGATVAQTGGPASGEAFPIGETTVEFTATDGAGLTDVCTFTVTVTGCNIAITSVSPVDETCPAAEDGTLTVTAACVTCAGGAADIRYSIDNVEFSNTTGVFSGLAPGTYMVYVQDVNDAGCTESNGPHTVASGQDTEDPVAACPDMAPEVVLSGGSGTLAADALAGGNSTDNCGSAVETSPETVFTCSDAPSAMVELTATDGSGNSHTADCPVTITAPVCSGAVDLGTWVQEGDPGSGSWSVSGNGSSVLQSVNNTDDVPTFFVSPNNFYNGVLEGSFEVTVTEDNDNIGFVLGYSKPNPGTAADDYDFVLFDWKQEQQDPNCDAEGFRLSRVVAASGDAAGFFCATNPGMDILATDYGAGKGWADNTEYIFRVEYASTNIKIYIDGNLIFDVDGSFPDGRFGFYNLSQSGVRYQQFSYPFAVVVEPSDASCPGASDGSAAALVSGPDQSPYTYLWSDGQTSQTATNLSAGTYQVTVTGSNCCEAVGEATISDTDVEAPVLTGCPGPQTLMAEAGECTVPLPDYTAGVTVTDNCADGAQPTAKFAPGRAHTVAIAADGSLWAWGWNSEGQLGIGSTTDQISPVQVGTDTDWASVNAADYHTLALKSDGSLWAWGDSSEGQLGTGSNSDETSPVQVGTGTDWVAVSAAGYHSLALKSDGSLWAWGYNSDGQLGIGSITDQNSPVQVGTATDWASVSAGIDHTLALKTDGSLWAWGSNIYGQLGDGSTTRRTSPVQVGTDTDWGSFRAGRIHSLAVKTDGSLWAWGGNLYGQLGTGSNTSENSPAQVGATTDWASVSAGIDHSMALKTDGSLWAWGRGIYGVLGTGSSAGSTSPVQVGDATDWTACNAGGFHTAALKADGSLLAWGWNTYGQLGIGSNTNQSTPTVVPNFTNDVGGSAPTVDQLPAPGTALSAGTHEITLSSTDAAGNTGTCTVMVTVEDNEAPVITCPQSIEEVATSPSGAVVTFADATATDNCGATVAQTGGPASGEAFPIGETTVEFTATDGAGLTDVCTFTVTVTGCNIAITSVSPVDETCPAAEDGTLTVTAACVTCAGGAADIRYSIDNVEFSNTTGVFSGLAPGTYMVYVQDVNDAGCTESNGPHTVASGQDTEDPVAVCPDMAPEVVLSAGSGTLAADALAGGNSTDNCGSAVETSPETVFTCSDVPSAMVELTATDGSGNSHTADCPVTITAPVCSGAVDLGTWVQEGDPGSGSWSVSGNGSSVLQSVNNTNDVPTFFVSPNNFYNGVLEGSFEVTVTEDNDNIGFVLGYSKPNPGTAADDYDFVLFDWKQEQQDPNCDAEGFRLSRVVAASGDAAGFFCATNPNMDILATDYGPGKGWADNTEYIFRVEYASTNIKIYIDGNLIFDVDGSFPDGRFGFYNLSQSGVRYQQFSYPFAVVVEPADASCPGASDGSAAALVSGPDQSPYTYLWSDGQTSQTATGLSAGTYQVTVTGSNCCEAVGEVTISDADVVAPTITCPGDVTASTDAGICTASGVSLGTATASDNCAATPTVSSDTAGPFGLGSTAVTFTADDGNGNTNTCTMMVTVEDNEAPVITCPDDIFVENDPGTCGAVVDYPIVTATDNCDAAPAVSLLSGLASGETFDLGENLVTFEATDAAGNTADCTFQVNVGSVDPVTTDFDLVGNASAQGGDCYQLTIDDNDQIGAIWYQQKMTLESDFELDFDIYLGANNETGADGMAFVLQPLSTGEGGVGGGIGYQGITPSVSVEFDTYHNSSFSDPLEDHVAIQKDGVVDHGMPSAVLSAPVTVDNLEDDSYHAVRIAWDAGTKTLDVFLDGSLVQSLTSDLANTVFGGDPGVFWGWTGATAFYTNRQEVCVNNLSFTELVYATATATDESCPGEADGGLNLTPGGGVSPYTFSWSNGATTEDLSGLSAGGYTVTITDQCGRTATQAFTVGGGDAEAPVAVCPALPDVEINANGVATLPANIGTARSTDNCGTPIESSPALTFNCAQLGTQTVTLTANDGNGNTGTTQCSFEVTDPNGNCVAGTDCDPNPVVLNDNPITTGVYGSVSTVESAGTIPASESVLFTAGQTITLKPGFTASAGSSFTARIEDCVPFTEDPVNAMQSNDSSEEEGYDFILDNGQPEENLAGEDRLNVFPNPFKNQATIALNLAEDKAVDIRLFDMNGKLVSHILPLSLQPSGDNQYTLDGDRLAAGVYILAVRAGEQMHNRRLVVIQ